MIGAAETWDGHEWEEHVLRLLHDQYGPENVQKVPSKHRGDAGLDYFCLARLLVHQCYAVEEPVDVATRATKQKSKITTDITKFCDPSKGAAQMFNGHRIKRWILAVPLLDSREVVEHAMRKANEVRAKNLLYVDPDFQILIHDRTDFDDASWARRIQIRNKIRPLMSPPTDEEIIAVSKGHQSLIENLKNKLKPRFDDLNALEDAVDDALRVLLQSQNAIESLRNIAPEAYEDVTRLREQRLRRLTLGSRGAANVDRLDSEIDELKRSMLKAIPNLDEGTAEIIAFGAVSDWLMRCPLRLN